jgi:hypothetical protein
LYDLDAQARPHGGALFMLNGNHEALNVCGDFRYVTPAALVESAVEFGVPREEALQSWEACVRARAALFLPGGRVAREMLSRNPTVLVVNDTAFAHGGLLPEHGERALGRSLKGWRWQGGGQETRFYCSLKQQEVAFSTKQQHMKQPTPQNKHKTINKNQKQLSMASRA